MALNKIFLGDNSSVQIATTDTVDEIKFKLASRHSLIRRDPSIRSPFEHEDFSPGYVYFIKSNGLKIYFSDDLNRKIFHNFSLQYPFFAGQIIDNGKHRLIKGEIGRPEWTYFSLLLLPVIFTFCLYIKLTQGEVDGINIPLYLACFGAVIAFIDLARTRRKVKEMSDEIDRVFANTR